MRQRAETATSVNGSKPSNNRNQFGATRPEAHFVRAAVAGRYAA
jgi:hypothetical protein